MQAGHNINLIPISKKQENEERKNSRQQHHTRRRILLYIEFLIWRDNALASLYIAKAVPTEKSLSSPFFRIEILQKKLPGCTAAATVGFTTYDHC